MTDMSVANHMASQTTLQQEQGSGPVFTPEQQANLTPADVAALDPQRARDGMSEMHSIVFRQAEATVASRDRVLRGLVEPFLGALPDLVARHGVSDENLRQLLAEVLNVMVGLRMSLSDRALDLPGLHDSPPDDLPEEEKAEFIRGIAAALPVPNVKYVAGPSFTRRLEAIAEQGGIWIALGSKELIERHNAEDPVTLLNWLAEFRQYASKVSFKVKLEGHQIKMLQAFFRTN